jgi:hypothetical protein
MKKRPENNGIKRISTLIVAAAFACFELCDTSNAFGVIPAPDGGYAGGNTAEGQDALQSLTNGVDNTAIGLFSLLSVTDANFNTGVGAGTLLSNTGDQNTATGAGALLSNSTGESNTASGGFALFSNTTANFNTAIGFEALFSNIVGSDNTATGAEALLSNIDGTENTAAGGAALLSNTSGSHNTAVGESALIANTTASNNTAVGSGALPGVTTGEGNTALGAGAGNNLTDTDSNNIDIGFNVLGVSAESNTIRIGNNDITDTFIRGISGKTIPNGAAVLVAQNGQLGTITSSRRFKDEIKPMDKASEALFSLKPVTFRYKKEIDPIGTQQFGLVAEDVEKVSPDLVFHDENGFLNTVRYEQVNAMLLNEFLKEHRKVRKLEATFAEQQNDFQSKLAKQEKQIAALASDLQKISARLEISRPAPQMVLSNR